MWALRHLNVALTHMPKIHTYFIGHSGLKSAVFVAIAFFGVFAVVGCSKSSDAQLNTVFSPTQAFGPQGDALVKDTPALNDKISNRVLDKQELNEVRAILESVVQGDVLPMKSAANAIRFEDSPRAMTSAAKIVEMAILSSVREWPRIEFLLSAPNGVVIPLVVTIKEKRALVRPSITTDDPGIRRIHAQIAAAMTRAFIRSHLDDPIHIETLGRDVIAEQGLELTEVRSIPERYIFDLTMLDGQPAQLIVTRRPKPRVASWEITVGLFGDPAVHQSLDKAFTREMYAWGSVLRPAGE